jgi:hypothetical protein
MGFNKKVLSQIKSDLNSAKAPARKKDIIVDPAGQWKYPGQATRIPSNQITMQGVNYPVFAQPNIGQPQMMYPGQDYNFPGANYVDEYPQMKKGGQKKYSRSLEATNKLFTANPYVKKKKSKKKKIFNPNAKYYQDGGESRSEELLGSIPLNSGRKTLRDWTYGESIGMLQEDDGGYIELDLTPEEIEEYKRGGYVVEDISIPSLTRFIDGGGKEVRQVKKEQRKAARNFEYNPEAEFSLSTQPGEEDLPAYMYPGKTVAIDPIPIKSIEIADRETPELDTSRTAEYYANRAKEAREEKRQSLKNTDNIKYKKLSRPAGEIILENEMNDEMSQALKNAGYYVNQLESGDYEVIANKDIANLIYKKGITANELSNKFKLGDAKTLQKYFQPVYDNAQSIHAKRNVGKIDDLIDQGYTKDQAIKALAKQGEGTVSGLSNLYGNYAEATYQKNKAEADALTALGVTNIDDLTDYQKSKLLDVYAFKTGKEAEVNKAQEEAEWISRNMPTVADNTAYRGAIGVNASGQTIYGTTAYDEAQNEINVANNLVDNFKYKAGAQAEAAKAILTSDKLTDEQRKQLMENPDKFNEIYKSYVNWMTAPQGEQWEEIVPAGDYSLAVYRNKETGEISYGNGYTSTGYTEYTRGTPKSDFTLTSEGTPSWQEGTYTKTRTIDGPVQSADWVWTGGVLGGAALGAGAISDLAYGVGTLGENLLAGYSAPSFGLGTATTLAEQAAANPYTWENLIRATTLAGLGKEYIVDPAITGEAPELSVYNTAGDLASLLSPYNRYTSGLSTSKSVGEGLTEFSQKGVPQSFEDIQKLGKTTIGISKLPRFKQYGGEQNYEEAELTPEEIEAYRRQGYIIEEY